MFYILISILGVLFTIFFVVGTHESAHFLMARLLHVKVLRFSIGFGKALLRWHDKSGTEYIVALIPLGGYVKMLDEGEGAVPKNQLPFAYNRQPFYKKALIVAAGPAMNILCAFLLYWLIFIIGFTTIKPIVGDVKPHSIAAEAGLQTNQEIISVDHHETNTWPGILLRLTAHAGNQDHANVAVRQNSKIKIISLDLSDWQLNGLSPDLLGSLGITPFQPPIPLNIGIIAEKSPAKNQLHIGDKLIAVNKTAIKDWQTLITFISTRPDEKVVFTIERKQKILEIPITLSYQRDLLFKKKGYLGIGPQFTWPKEYLREIKYTPLAALPRAWQQITDFTQLNFILFGKLLTGKISLQSLGGPITIFETAGEALNYGIVPFLGFLAFLSISIGIINVLPIPGLDGGHLCLQFIEFIIRRPVPERIMSILYRLGLLLIVFILLQSLINDVLRITL